MTSPGISAEWELLVVDADEQTACEAEKALASSIGKYGSPVTRLEALDAVEPLLAAWNGAPTLVLCKIDAQNIVDFFPLMFAIRNHTQNTFVVVYTELLEPSITWMLTEHGVTNVVPLLSDGHTGLLLNAAVLQVDRRFRASIQAETTAAAGADAAADRQSDVSTATPSCAETPTALVSKKKVVAQVALLLAQVRSLIQERPLRDFSKLARSVGNMKELLSKFTKRLGFHNHRSQSNKHDEAFLKCGTSREDSASQLFASGLSDNVAACVVMGAREDSAIALSSKESENKGGRISRASESAVGKFNEANRLGLGRNVSY
eukprot:CAMPEP_0118933928 /NCGR_PEP_ID=MMETSP1169-20130426/13046_1 /TAXON_ID=36882 /ORGANISM="Pyramimonas obovata, Strain CCMP722" /LENGTH=318 /DNA_ID=CAMNT_0006876767 /DNA_START=121 /DNA_END=1077 /DNA_ORIENTATION=+